MSYKAIFLTYLGLSQFFTGISELFNKNTFIGIMTLLVAIIFLHFRNETFSNEPLSKKNVIMLDLFTCFIYLCVCFLWGSNSGENISFFILLPNLYYVYKLEKTQNE
jgi:hypothetical protein